MAEPDTGSTPRTALISAWTSRRGAPPPKNLSTRLLALAVAYDEQVARSGDVKPAARRAIRRLQESRPERHSPNPPAGRKGVQPGTRLIREWHGKTHVADVLEHGVLHDGRVYRSLSEVARAITGARWSGPRFFGTRG